jgi:glycine hydroxymethyltransferase
MILCKKQFALAIDKAAFPGFQGGPHMNNIAAKAVAFGEALEPEFQEYAQNILENAKVLSQALEGYGFHICFGKTQNHMMLIDTVKSKDLSGKEVEEALDAVGITLNKNMVPDEPRSAFDPSGVRLGVPAATTRGMGVDEMLKIASWINDVCDNINDDKKLKKIAKDVKKVCKKFPIYK